MTALPNDDLMDAAECAAYLRRTPGAVRMLVLRRSIPFRKPGGRLIFLRPEIDAWVRGSPGLTLEEVQNEKI